MAQLPPATSSVGGTTPLYVRDDGKLMPQVGVRVSASEWKRLRLTGRRPR
jgi:hypothetical protein